MNCHQFLIHPINYSLQMFPGRDKSLQTARHERKVIFTHAAIVWVRFCFGDSSVPLRGWAWRPLPSVFFSLLSLQRATRPSPHRHVTRPRSVFIVGSQETTSNGLAPAAMAPSPGVKPRLVLVGGLEPPEAPPCPGNAANPARRESVSPLSAISGSSFLGEKPVLPEEAGGAGRALGRSGRRHRAQRRGEGSR